MIIRALIVSTLLAAGLWGQSAWDVPADPPSGFNRSWGQSTTLEHLVELVALDTRNPPGNERLTADWLATKLGPVPGIETWVLDVGDGRANFVARLSAQSATARPVIIMAHMDTVGVDEAAWDTPPLQATLVDGYVHGRGVMDDKGMLSATVTALGALAPRRDELKRDVILVATAGEEGGPPVGIDEIIANHRELLGDAAFALNEGGRIRIRDDEIFSVNVQTTEKLAYSVAVRAEGPSGHGSVPLPDNALAALARAVAALHEWQAPLMLNDTTRLYFERLAAVEPDADLRWAMQHITSEDATERRRADEVLSADPATNAVLRVGQSLTRLDGGFRNNVIPSEGQAVFNTRILPEDDIDVVVSAMSTVAAGVAGDQVTVELIGEARTSPPPSPVTTELFAALESAAAAMAPHAVVVPFMSTGATDGAALRAIGIPTYGILPFPMVPADELTMHGDNERVPVAALGWGAEFLYRTLLEVSR